MSTSTIGPTAMNASSGCRSVNQKKSARMPSATATVVLTARVCPPVISSVTAMDWMLSDVAVTAPSSPNQSASRSSWSARVAAGSPEKVGNCTSSASMPSGSSTSACPVAGSSSWSRSRNCCISTGSSRTPTFASRKMAASSGSYLSPASPLSSVQSLTSSS